MSKALSFDLRVRVLSAVAAGATHRAAAERFGVSAASVSRWRKRKAEQGNPRSKALGGERRSGRIEAHHEAVEAALGPGRDATIEEVRANIREAIEGWLMAEDTVAQAPADQVIEVTV